MNFVVHEPKKSSTGKLRLLQNSSVFRKFPIGPLQVVISFFLIKKHLNWSLIALPCCAVFCCTRNWISSTRTHIPALVGLPPHSRDPACGMVAFCQRRGPLPLGVGTHGAQGRSRQRLRPGRTQVKTRPRTPDLETSGCHASAWKCTGSRRLRISSCFSLRPSSLFPLSCLFPLSLDPSDHVIIGSFHTPQISAPS